VAASPSMTTLTNASGMNDVSQLSSIYSGAKRFSYQRHTDWDLLLGHSGSAKATMTNTSTDEPTGKYPPVAQSNVTVRFRDDAERLQSD